MIENTIMNNVNYLIKNLTKEVNYNNNHNLDVTTDDDFSQLNDDDLDGTDIAQHLDSFNTIRTAGYLNVLMNYANDDMTRVQFYDADPVYDSNLNVSDILKIMKSLKKLGANGIIKRAKHNRKMMNKINHLEKSMQVKL